MMPRAWTPVCPLTGAPSRGRLRAIGAQPPSPRIAKPWTWYRCEACRGSHLLGPRTRWMALPPAEA